MKHILGSWKLEQHYFTNKFSIQIPFLTTLTGNTDASKLVVLSLHLFNNIIRLVMTDRLSLKSPKFCKKWPII